MNRFLFILATSVLFSCGSETIEVHNCPDKDPAPVVISTPTPIVTATPIPEVTPTPIPELEGAQSYGTFTPGRETVKAWSFFTTIERNGCQLPMVLYAANGAIVSPIQASFTRQAFDNAVTTWAGSLDQNDSWPCKGQVQARWQSTRSIPGTIAVFIDAAVQRSYAVVGNYEIRLSPQYSNPGEPYAELVILHEMGHMAGLSDTYSEPGYQQPIGQPEGIMNNLYRVSSLTPDDIAGANALYDYMNGRGQFCDDGYTVGGAYENKNRVAFCVPT